MARSPLTLAALATSAVDALDVTSASPLGSTGSATDAALLFTRDGSRLIVRVPRTKSSDTALGAELTSLRALSGGIRARLPFPVPTFLGDAPAPPTRAFVYDHLAGTPVDVTRIGRGDPLAANIGRGIAAVHSLPTSFVADADLPIVRPLDALTSVSAIMDRATSTGLVPAALVDRWEHATEDAALWQFAPTVIHGDMSSSVILHEGDAVTGILGWHALSVGDPARDLFWALGSTTTGAADGIFEAYNIVRGSTDRQTRKRAMLYAELEIAKWLLHGTEQRSTDIVDDAVAMLHDLVDVVQHDGTRNIDTNTRPVMTVEEVEAMLDRDERHPEGR
ncbi:phosphotransferase [Marisediminicola senii]|uniref:phosphotransferase n=1 Tax=Marisediminicola senii TaxID=2711233 RepID=UPI0013ECB375|nr:phosphotransferase [Marisediminicola senii]